MDKGHAQQLPRGGKSTSTQKALRTVLLAILFHTYWPRRLSRDEIIAHLTYFYGSTPIPALYRDLETLTGVQVESLPEPGDPQLDEWCEQQRQFRQLAITYERRTVTFGLAQAFLTIDISEDEARAFIALQEAFTPGTPYADAVQHLLRRWEWLFTEKSHQLLLRKRQRRARPVVIQLSPVVDYRQHEDTILALDQALEEGAYISFAYTPLVHSRNAEPVLHEYVEPFELEYRDGHWYFTAFVFELNTFLDYRVDRIRPGTVRKASDHFSPGVRRGPGVKISYWVSPMIARHGSLSTRLREQQVTMLDNDQGAIVEGYAKSIWWAHRLLLGYGEQVKALSPQKLVEAMRESVGAMNELYGEES